MSRLSWPLAIVPAIIAIVVAFLSQQKQNSSIRELIPGRNNTALFLSNAEHGQLNVFLASAQALLLNHPDVEIHFATFGRRAKDVDSINDYANLQLPVPRNIIFHELTSTPSFADVMVAKNYTVAKTINPPGYRGSTRLCRDIQIYLCRRTFPHCHITHTQWPVIST